MKIEFNEENYSRCRALGLNDLEISHVFCISIENIEDFKLNMNILNYFYLYEDNLNNEITIDYKRKLKSR